MLEREGDVRGIKPGVERIEHGTEHRNGIMRLDHFRNVRRHDGHGIEMLDSEPSQRGSEANATIVQLGVGVATLAVDDRGLVRKRAGGAAQKADRSQRDVVGRVAIKSGLKGVITRSGHGQLHRCLWHPCIHWLYVRSPPSTITWSPLDPRVMRTNFPDCERITHLASQRTLFQTRI